MQQFSRVRSEADIQQGRAYRTEFMSTDLMRLPILHRNGKRKYCELDDEADILTGFEKRSYRKTKGFSFVDYHSWHSVQVDRRAIRANSS